VAPPVVVIAVIPSLHLFQHNNVEIYCLEHETASLPLEILPKFK